MGRDEIVVAYLFGSYAGDEADGRSRFKAVALGWMEEVER